MLYPVAHGQLAVFRFGEELDRIGHYSDHPAELAVAVPPLRWLDLVYVRQLALHRTQRGPLGAGELGRRVPGVGEERLDSRIARVGPISPAFCQFAAR